MKLGKLIELLRQQLDDTAKPYLWSDIELIAYINEAEREACRRARLIVDSTTSAICSISISASTAKYALDSRVISIRRAKLASRTIPLGWASYLDLDENRPGWETETGEIEAYNTDLNTGYILFYRIPTASDTVTLTVVREPLAEMNDLEETPEIPTRYHVNMLRWAMVQAYLKPDSETKNDELAQLNEALFTQEFGPKRSALDEAYEYQHQYSTEDGAY